MKRDDTSERDPDDIFFEAGEFYEAVLQELGLTRQAKAETED